MLIHSDFLVFLRSTNLYASLFLFALPFFARLSFGFFLVLFITLRFI